METLGRKHWAGAEGCIPVWSHGPEPELESHEALCILNTGSGAANIELTLFYENRAPAGPYRMTVEAQRTKHVRLNSLSKPEPVAKGTNFAWSLHSDEPVVVQHTRLDSRQAENALMTAVPYSQD
jgi:hypothetical protein